jgi:hypothetical protein
MLVDIIVCLISAAIGFWIGQSWAKARRVIQDSTIKPVRYRLLEITYYDQHKVQELHRFLWAHEYDDWEDAQAEAKKRTDEDTLKNTFNHEYVVVEAP